VRDIMLEAVETRFSGPRATSMVEMLTVNGSAYTARETRICTRQLGLKPCFTPVRSPQSNDISEAVNHSSSIWPKIHPNIVALEGADECLCHAVQSWRADRDRKRTKPMLRAKLRVSRAV